MNFDTFFFATCMIASLSLSAQPSTDEVLRTAPTVTETTEMSNLASAWFPSSASTDLVWFLPPAGSKESATVGTLCNEIYKNGQVGTYRLYFPVSGLRMDLMIVE